MKKHDANSKGHFNGRPDGNGQTHRRSSSSSNNRRQNKKSTSKNSQGWIDNNSKTLTSHLPGLKGNGDKNNWKAKSFNGNGRPGNQMKNRGNQEWPNDGKGIQFRSKTTGQKNDHRNAYRSRRNNETKNEPRRNISPGPLNLSEQKKLPQDIDPFNLFCAYHLGIGANNTYRPSNLNQVAQRFGVEPAVIRQATKDYGLDSEAMLNKDFDLGLAQLDIQVAPEGISKVELAKGIYEEFLNAPIIKRDWEKIIEQDQKENARVFGS